MQPLSPKPYSKEQLRKQSHSAIEKKRRERINDQFSHLKNIVPNCKHTTNSTIHKLTILENTIDYIRKLEEQVATMTYQKGNVFRANGRYSSAGSMNNMNMNSLVSPGKSEEYRLSTVGSKDERNGSEEVEYTDKLLLLSMTATQSIERPTMSIENLLS